MNDNFKIFLQAIIDDSSLTKVQKDLARKKLEIQADIDFSNFAKSKADIEKQFRALSGIIKDILGDAVSDKQATQWAKQYYKEIESGAKQAVKEQEKLSERQRQAYEKAQRLNARENNKSEASKQKDVNAILNQQKGTYQEIWNVNQKIAALNPQKDSQQISALQEKKKLYQDFYISSQKELQVYSNLSINQKHLNELSEIRRKSEAEILVIKNKQADKKDYPNDTIKYNIDTEKYSTQISSLHQQLSKFGIESGESFLQASATLKQLEATYNEMKFSDGDERLDHEKEYQKLLEKTKNLLTQVKGQKSNELISNGDNRRISLVNELNNYLQKNTAMTKQSKQVIIEWINTLNSADDMTRGTFDNLMAQFKGLDAELRAANKLGLSWTDKFKQAVEKFGGWAMATGSVMELWNLFRRMPKEVYNIDTSMTDLYKVTDETERKYSKFLDNASSKAQDLGRSISGLVEQTADWAKLGFDIDQASELAAVSSVYSNVGEVDDSTAVKDLVTAMKAFNIEASDSISIVDSLNKLGNEFATDAKSLGEGLRNSASSMAVAGNDINQTLALLTGGGEISQNVGELGNALRVVSMRLRGMKGQLQEIGEEYENVESISKIQTQIYNLSKGNVNIFKDDGSFKSTYEQLKEISKIYFQLNDSDRADLTEIMFGKNRANQGIALLQAFQSGQIEKAYEASVHSAGSAMQEQERWMESLEAKTQQLEAAFQSLSTTVFDSNFLKVLVDSGITLTNVLDTVIDKIGVIPTLITGGSITAFIKNFDWLCNKSYLKIA